MIANVQLLRFLAAYAVAAFHFGRPYARFGDGLFGPFVLPFDTFGFVGVDVFFVISGYIMWRSTEHRHGRTDVLPFLSRRFVRIFLGYWPWLVIMLWVILVVRGKPAASIDWLNAITLWPGTPPLPTSWTLTFELMFYVAFGLFMLLPRRAALLALTTWGCATLGIGSAATWGNVDLLGGMPSLSRLVLSPYVAEFCAGSVLAATVTRMPRWWLLGLVAVLAFTAGVFLNIQEPWTTEKHLLRVLTFGSFGVAAVATALSVEEHNWRAGPVWILLGNASYALYLSHLPILHWGRTYWRVVKTHPDLLFGSLFVASVAISIIWYQLGERPMQRAANDFISRLFHRSSIKNVPAASTTAAID